mgnify:CR=1 FL=1
MTLQYIILTVVLSVCIIAAIRYFWLEWRENVRYRNYGCAGCAFYDTCKRKRKITKK